MVESIDGWKVAQLVCYLFISLLSFIGIRSLGRLDSLEKGSIQRDEFEKSIQQLRDDQAARHAETRADQAARYLETREALKRIEERIQVGTIASLTELVRINDERIRELKRWKHEIGDAYIPGAVDALKRDVDRLNRKVFSD